MKIAIVFGGNSKERDVSIHTGVAVAEAASKHFQTITFDIGDNFQSVHVELVDVGVVFNALHGGYGEDGSIQKYFEKFKIKYTGSDSNSSKICMDKNLTKLYALDNQIPTAKWKLILYDDYKNENFDIENLMFPLIVKPNNGGSTIGLSYVEKPNQLNHAILKSFKYSDHILIEEYKSGKEITACILNGQVLPLVEIRPKGFLYDYNSKYVPGNSTYLIPASINDRVARKISEDALKLYEQIGCRHYARADFIVNKNEYELLEINSLPGLTSTSLFPKSAKYAGINYDELIHRIINLAI